MKIRHPQARQALIVQRGRSCHPMLLLSFPAALISSFPVSPQNKTKQNKTRQDKTRHAGTSSSFVHRSRHLHTSAHLHMREGIPSDSRIAYGRLAAAAHTSLVRLKCHSFSRLSHLGCANCSVLLEAGDSTTRTDWRKWDESFLPNLLACVEGLRKKIGTCTPRSCWFFVDIRY
jgi:hypothetical protein